MGKAWDRGAVPRSFRCTRPPARPRAALSWLSVRSLDSGHDQFPVSRRAGAGCAAAWTGAQAERPQTPGRGRRGSRGRSPGAAYLQGCRRAPRHPQALPVGPTVSHGAPTPPQGSLLACVAPVLAWPLHPKDRGQSWEQGGLTGHTQAFGHPLCFRVAWGPEGGDAHAPPEKHQEEARRPLPDSAATGRAA